MKLHISALIGKFGKNYNVTLMYSNADTNVYPTPIAGITDSSVVKAACNFSKDFSIPTESIKQAAHFCDCSTRGSFFKASDLNSMHDTSNMALATFTGLSLSELNSVLSDIKTAVEEFSYCGDQAVTSAVNIG